MEGCVHVPDCLMQSVLNVNGQKLFFLFFILGCQVGHVISSDIMGLSYYDSTQYGWMDGRMIYCICIFEIE